MNNRQSTSSTFLAAAAPLEAQRNSGTRAKRCERCRGQFEINEQYYSVGNTTWHVDCFLCAQCIMPLAGETYYEFEGRMYCEHDFNVLYSPICGHCKKFIVGRVIRSANRSFHSKCMNCELCQEPLQKSGAYFHQGKLLCLSCSHLIPKEKIYNCQKCHQTVDDPDLLMVQSEPFHAYHFNCSKCKKQLDKDARTVKDDLLCQRCFDFQCEVCFGCKTVIDPQIERSTYSMGKHWHVDHFRCAICQHPFNGHEHYEQNGLAYCKADFLELVGHHCFYCNKMVAGTMIFVFNKKFCTDCYRCRGCDKALAHKDKVMELDMLPLCKSCMGQKNFKKALKEKADSTAKISH